MQASQLTLYKFDGCPFCDRVQATIERLGVEIEQRDVRIDPAHRQELIEATGRGTVPVLRIEEEAGKVRWLPESLDIMRFLEQHFSR